MFLPLFHKPGDTGARVPWKDVIGNCLLPSPLPWFPMETQRGWPLALQPAET